MSGRYSDLERVRRERAERAATPADSTGVEPEPVTPIPVPPPPPRGDDAARGVDPRGVDSTPLDPSPLGTIPLPERPRDAVRGDYTKLPNGLIGGDLKALTTGAQVLYLHLVQLTLGHNRQTCRIGHKRITERTGLSVTAIRRAVAQLEAFGLVEVLAVDSTSANVFERGSEYRVYLPRRTRLEAAGVDSTPADSRRVAPSAMKETLKEDHETPTVYDVRSIAVRLLEVHRTEPGFSRARLLELVRAALTGQGRAADEATIDEALRGMG
jgi:hypothetical protein